MGRCNIVTGVMASLVHGPEHNNECVFVPKKNITNIYSTCLWLDFSGIVG